MPTEGVILSGVLTGYKKVKIGLQLDGPLENPKTSGAEGESGASRESLRQKDSVILYKKQRTETSFVTLIVEVTYGSGIFSLNLFYCM